MKERKGPMEPRRLHADKALALLLSWALGLSLSAPSWAALEERPFNSPKVSSRGAPKAVPKLPARRAPEAAKGLGLPASALPAAPASAISAQALPSGAPEKISSVLGGLSLASEEAARAGEADPSGVASNASLQRLYSGGALQGAEFVANFEGVQITGRAAYMFNKVVEHLERLSKVDLSETINVMDDCYSELLAKLKMIRAVARDREVEMNSVHLDQTMTFVDAVMGEGAGRTAIHTTQVFFHPNKGNPRSEIEEGKRRAKGALREAVRQFAPGGPAESAMGPLRQVILGFDTRGYDEIKEFIKAEGRKYGPRYRLAFVDEKIEGPMPRTPAEVRKEVNAEIVRYGSEYQQREGLGKIIDGVIYSRYVGLMLELVDLKDSLDKGYRVLLSGRDIFDSLGFYITEFDSVVLSPQGEVVIHEAKSSRIPLPFEVVMRDKIRYKLDIYRGRKADLVKALAGELEKALAKAAAGKDGEFAEVLRKAQERVRARRSFDKVVFVMDVGPTGEVGNASSERNRDLAEKIKGQEAALSREYGFPVEFLFLEAPMPPQQLRTHDSDARASRRVGLGRSSRWDRNTRAGGSGASSESGALRDLAGKGYEISSQGLEVLDSQKAYVTRIDGVARGPRGKVAIVSALASVPSEAILRDKLIKKLMDFSKHRPAIEAAIGLKFDEVVFSLDPGSADDPAARALRSRLEAQQEQLRRHGFPVTFVFRGPRPSI